MSFNSDIIIQQLKSNKEIIEALFSNVPEAAIHWKQASDKWSPIIILCHLVDEELEDFRLRTKIQLETPGSLPPPIDPVAWVEERNYAGQDYPTKLNQWIEERENSIQWLESLQNPDWNSGYHHPEFGFLTAAFFLTNWLAHDYLHIKQMTKLKYDYVSQLSKHKYEYAGNWI